MSTFYETPKGGPLWEVLTPILVIILIVIIYNFLAKRKRNYYFGNTPVYIEFGYCLMTYDEEISLRWYNFDCLRFGGAYRIPAVKVSGRGIPAFVRANHYGSAIEAILKKTSPVHMFKLPVEAFENSNLPGYVLKEFDREGFEKYETERTEWINNKYS